MLGSRQRAIPWRFRPNMQKCIMTENWANARSRILLGIVHGTISEVWSSTWLREITSGWYGLETLEREEVELAYFCLWVVIEISVKTIDLHIRRLSWHRTWSELDLQVLWPGWRTWAVLEASQLIGVTTGLSQASDTNQQPLDGSLLECLSCFPMGGVRMI